MKREYLFLILKLMKNYHLTNDMKNLFEEYPIL